MRLLEKDPEDRYQTGAELIRALDAASPPPQRASRRPAPLPPPPPRKWVLLLATGLGVLITLTGYRLLRPSEPEVPAPATDPAQPAP